MRKLIICDENKELIKAVERYLKENEMVCLIL